MNIEQITPMPGKIIVKKLVDDTVTKSGIVLTTVMNNNFDYVEVIKIGKSTDVISTDAFTIGDKCIVMGKGIYDKFTLDNSTYFIINPADIYAILEE